MQLLGPILGEHRDVLELRVEDPEVPAWAERLGWTAFLAGLSDDALDRAETTGPARSFAADRDAPSSLREVAREISAIVSSVDAAPSPSMPSLVGAGRRKREQVGTFASLTASFIASFTNERVVDVGAGHGHLTRYLASSLGLATEGVERNAAAVARARALSIRARSAVDFRHHDAGEISLSASDLVIGLHACGDLADRIVERAEVAGASVLLVGCCYQKIAGERRRARSELGKALGISWSREVLGLANLATVEDGGTEAARVMVRRRTRYALRWLLVQHGGIEVRPGEETHGIHRRQFKRSLSELAPRAFALRGLALPNAAAIANAEEAAAAEHATVRRFTLARTLFARPLELAIAADRAASLDGGRLALAFHGAASPRNLAILRR